MVGFIERMNECRKNTDKIGLGISEWSIVATNSLKSNQAFFKTVLCTQFYRMLELYYQNQLEIRSDSHTLDVYIMNNKIIKLLIEEIVNTGEYTLEGIAYHTRIPFDVIDEAACGLNAQISIAAWVKIIDLYFSIKPEAKSMLIKTIMEDQFEFKSVSCW